MRKDSPTKDYPQTNGAINAAPKSLTQFTSKALHPNSLRTFIF